MYKNDITFTGTPPTGPPPDLPGKCPSTDWLKKGIHCYLFKVQYTETKNFNDAEEVIIMNILGPDSLDLRVVLFHCS